MSRKWEAVSEHLARRLILRPKNKYINEQEIYQNQRFYELLQTTGSKELFIRDQISHDYS